MKAAIAILNYNGRHHLEQYLPSVMEHCPEWAKVFVIDNASTDHSLSFLRNIYPEVQVVELSKNFGFAGGYNQGLKQIEAPYYALLNSDVEVSQNWLETLAEFLENNSEAAAVQPKIRDYIHRDYFEYAGAAGGFIDKYGYPFCRGRLFLNCERDIGQHDDAREVFWATGACMLIKSEKFWEVGGFDERLFAHMEEIDLCWRLKNINYQVFCEPKSHVFHLGGGTLSSQNPRKTYLNFRNSLIVFYKNDYQAAFLSRFVIRLLLDGVAACSFLFNSGFPHFTAVLHAHYSFYKILPQLRNQRKNLQAQSTTINRTGILNVSIVRLFYLKKRKVFGALSNRSFMRQQRSK